MSPILWICGAVGGAAFNGDIGDWEHHQQPIFAGCSKMPFRLTRISANGIPLRQKL